MIYKRYQYWSSNGIKWTEWFEWNSILKPEFQLRSSKLLNEYKL